VVNLKHINQRSVALLAAYFFEPRCIYPLAVNVL